MRTVIPWEQQGCAQCRRQWESGNRPPLIGESDVDRSSLHRCEACGALWMQTERYAAAVDPQDLPAVYRGLMTDIAASQESAEVDRYFVRFLRDRVPFALLRRHFTADGFEDQVLSGVDEWRPDSRGSVDRAVRFVLDSDLEPVTAAQAAEVERMVAERRYRPLHS